MASKWIHNGMTHKWTRSNMTEKHALHKNIRDIDAL